jgi:hypothetical protein
MEKILGLSIGGHGAGTGTIFPANKHLVGAAAGVVTVRMFLLCSRND